MHESAKRRKVAWFRRQCFFEVRCVRTRLFGFAWWRFEVSESVSVRVLYCTVQLLLSSRQGSPFDLQRRESKGAGDSREDGMQKQIPSPATAREPP